MDKKNIDIHFIEKRRHPRFSIHCLAEVLLAEEAISATAIDISEGGIGIIIPHQFNIGEDIKLLIKFGSPLSKKDYMEVKAKVIWVGRENEKKMYICGLEIIDISDDNLDLLRNQIQTLIGDE